MNRVTRLSATASLLALLASGALAQSNPGFTGVNPATPLTATTSGVTATLPAGPAVVVSNTGANAVYCQPGAAATTSSQYIPSSGWFEFQRLPGQTQVTCITATGTSVVNLVGGVGQASGIGGGGSGSGGGGYPTSATPETASATGTTTATTATLATAAGKTTFICSFSIRANANAATTNNATVTGTITGTLNFTQWTAPNTSGLGVAEMIFTPCVPASGTNQAIAVISGAPGTGGVVSVTATGYLQ